MFFRENKERCQFIVCPHCGREYLPAEIYIPEVFIGQPTDIEREGGKIDMFDGTDMNTTETYQCDGCGKSFNIEAEVKFKTTPVKDTKFEEVYSAPLNIKKISLFEG